jgi:hypothetical protein
MPTILSTTPIGANSSTRRSRKQLKERRGSTESEATEEVKAATTAATLKWLMATVLVARTRFGSLKVTAPYELGLSSWRKAAPKIAALSV